MKIIFKVLVGIFLFMISIILTAIIVMYRKDVPLVQLEPLYFTENSHYITLSIKDANNELVHIDVHYIDYGTVEDPVIVLLHGLFASSHTFLPWAEELVSQGYRVLLVDLPHHGLSGNFADNKTSQRRSAALVKALLDELAISKVIIGGNSMGGGVSWYFASEYHQVDDFIVDGLILIDAVYPQDDYNRTIPATIPKRFIVFLSKMTPKFLMRYILQGVYGSGSEFDDQTLNRYYDLLRKEDNRKYFVTSIQEEYADLLTGVERLHQIRDANIPVLVLWGGEDSWIPVSVADSFKQTLALDDEQIIVYPYLGHVPMEEDPQTTILDVIKFLDDIKSP